MALGAWTPAHNVPAVLNVVKAVTFGTGAVFGGHGLVVHSHELSPTAIRLHIAATNADHTTSATYSEALIT